MSAHTEDIERKASAGDIDAMAALGRQLLSRPPFDAPEGIRLTAAAADNGNGEAARMLAVLSSAGVGVPQSWQAALTHLRRAAELGGAAAQSELAFLAGKQDLAAALTRGEPLASQTWEELRRAVDVRTWLDPPKARIASQTPRIAIAENFLAPAVCDWLIEKGRPHLRRARTDDPTTGKLRYENVRTNSSAELDLDQTDLVVHLVRARMSALAGPPPRAMEGSVVLHYRVGEQFFPHHDFLDVNAPGYARQVAEHGQRVLTFLIYLNDGYDGGETEFPAAGWRHKGKKGDGIFFWNVLPSGQPDRQTLHAGLAPTRGEKWLFSQWVRGRIS